ncbi:MAG: hypothetical protein WC517_01920 [Patescibacteria group bacterium]
MINPSENHANKIENDQQKLPDTTNQEDAKSVEQKEISPEERKQAEITILDTLEIGQDGNLDNFENKLKRAVQSLPLYQQIEKKLKNIEPQTLPHELFKVLKRDSDEEQIDPNAPKDGVLIKSMRQGRIECAGRALIASTFLQEHGIDHVAVSAPGHAFIVIEQSPDTLVYFDANNNLFFTFPKFALKGYKGIVATAECRLGEYTPRDNDMFDGVNTTFSHFIAMPAKEGISRQYLENVAAALNGNKEFETTGIVVDQEASEAVHQIETEIYEKNKLLDNFNDGVEDFIEKEDLQTEDDKKVIGEILRLHPNHEDFVAFLPMVLNGNFGDRVPYIKNASPEQKRAYAEQVWDFLQKRAVNDIIQSR